MPFDRIRNWLRPASASSGSQPAPADVGLDDNPLTAIGQLELISRRTVDGLLSGKHRSTHRGGCTDFAEHRQYSVGDDIRRIDWRLHARNDRYHVKQYDDETNLRAIVAVDASGSMAYAGTDAEGQAAQFKFDLARTVGACLARLLMRQRDAVGLAIIGESIKATLPPRVKPDALHQINEMLAKATLDGGSRLGPCLVELAARNRRRGLLVVLTDGFCDLADFKTGLLAWTGRGSDVVVVETLAADELSFGFREPLVLEDLERPGFRMEVDPGTLRDAYLERLERHRVKFHATVTQAGGQILTVTNDEPVGPVLRHFLQRRHAAAKVGGRT